MVDRREIPGMWWGRNSWLGSLHSGQVQDGPHASSGSSAARLESVKTWRNELQYKDTEPYMSAFL